MMMTVAWQGEGSIFLHEGERIVILIFMRDSLRKKGRPMSENSGISWQRIIFLNCVTDIARLSDVLSLLT